MMRRCAICSGEETTAGQNHRFDCPLHPWNIKPFMAPSGWYCPRCGSYHAPDVKTCPVTVTTMPGYNGITSP